METLSVEVFGRKLLESLDLDPVYVVVHKMGMDRKQVQRWMLAHWCFDHCGLASYLSERTGQLFWKRAFEAAQNTTPAPIDGRWPRGASRRHYRGDNGTRSMGELARKYLDPEDFARYVSYGEPTSNCPLFADVTRRVQEHDGFGPWAGFKVADMLERLTGVPVQFTDAEVMMFKDPAQGALMVWDAKNAGKEVPPVPERLRWACKYLLGVFGKDPAPPDYDRQINIQEVETILCKWKSHCRGHYSVGKDSLAIRKEVQGWDTVSDTAAQFARVAAEVWPFPGIAPLPVRCGI